MKDYEQIQSKVNEFKKSLPLKKVRNNPDIDLFLDDWLKNPIKQTSEIVASYDEEKREIILKSQNDDTKVIDLKDKTSEFHLCIKASSISWVGKLPPIELEIKSIFFKGDGISFGEKSKFFVYSYAHGTIGISNMSRDNHCELRSVLVGDDISFYDSECICEVVGVHTSNYHKKPNLIIGCILNDLQFNPKAVKNMYKTEGRTTKVLFELDKLDIEQRKYFEENIYGMPNGVETDALGNVVLFVSIDLKKASMPSISIDEKTASKSKTFFINGVPKIIDHRIQKKDPSNKSLILENVDSYLSKLADPTAIKAKMEQPNNGIFDFDSDGELI